MQNHVQKTPELPQLTESPPLRWPRGSLVLLPPITSSRKGQPLSSTRVPDDTGEPPGSGRDHHPAHPSRAHSPGGVELVRIVPGQVREVEAPRVEDQGGQVDHVAARQGEAGGSASVWGSQVGHKPMRRGREHSGCRRNIRGRPGFRMGQRGACSPKPLALASVVCLGPRINPPTSLGLMTGQSSLISLQTSKLPLPPAAGNKGNGTSVGFCSGRKAPSPRTRGMLCLSSNRKIAAGGQPGLGVRGTGPGSLRRRPRRYLGAGDG